MYNGTLCLVTLVLGMIQRNVEIVEATSNDDAEATEEIIQQVWRKRTPHTNYYFPYNWHANTRRRPDYRFFHVGIGKRNDNLSQTGPSPKNQELADRKFRNNMTLTIPEEVNPFVASMYRLLAESQPSQRQGILRNLLSKVYSNNINKRVPEAFSETLYPIQAGQQQYEANLDNIVIRADTFDPRKQNDEINEGEATEETVNLPFAKERNLQIESPSDLLFASPDLYNDNVFKNQP